MRMKGKRQTASEKPEGNEEKEGLKIKRIESWGEE